MKKTMQSQALKNRMPGWLATCLSLILILLGMPLPAAGQTIAAGTSQTNLPTETVWPGAQNPPYICCWSQQGQFVTFSFNVAAAGATSLALRYSAGNSNSARKIELDGAVLAANEIFPSTGNWSTWTLLTLTPTLASGSHTLTVIFDSTSGSSGYINLDNLSVSPIATSQTIAAGKSQTNLPTETTWPGAQDPPYICCWSQQGQFVTFSFNAAAGATSLALRYSAGNSNSTRKIELDGTVLDANETFPSTGNWDTWTTLTLTPTLTSGTHTLTVLFDGTSGSAGYINLDNLTVGVANGTTPNQTIAAGKSQTNLPTETTWPGAQDPPYICCWSKQGQFVTFSFSAAAGPVGLSLRYSAGNSNSTRKIELDGAILAANETFPSTGNWNTWTTLTLTPTVTSGTHTLTVLFDSTSGSAGYINLDNLTVGPVVVTPPSGAVVAVGYADGTAGLTPWMGSANTDFLGAPPQCCLTHGPGNGSPGYDGGAIEITNPSGVAITVNAVTVDFGGGSSPSHFDLWSGGGANALPQQVPPGSHLVLTMNSSFNFDTSDLFGEACNRNSGVVPVVHVTVNGTQTDYLDSHQLLNSDGTDLASCPGDSSEQAPFTTQVAGAQPAAPPVNPVKPAATGTPITGRIVSGFAGGWNASPPPSLTLQWLRCDSAGGTCAAISGATTATYRPVSTDVGSTLRLQVTGTNASGTLTAASTPTSAIASGPAVAQMGDTSTGATSLYIYQTTQLEAIFSASSSGTTNDFEFFARGASGTQSFTPQIYSVVGGQKGVLLGTGVTMTVPLGTDGTWYVSSLSGIKLVAGTQYMLALTPSGIKSTYVGSETNGSMAFFVDYAPGN